ncbi:hypothetical protein PRIPAC_96683 [Pristionchus pacificus]|uniref:Uncharacterized protein n=1 Tax=Pristionchus pacificus TaxID=54126 RepID=A0A2A6CUT9_PRIPA|nr:hypothetical protein PRIPAC_96683 [Pristionchus pacificus]|eukprot:PDM81945.1 hypothetical protein PRIPAC_34099 [Pristionchus pacificus]
MPKELGLRRRDTDKKVPESPKDVKIQRDSNCLVPISIFGESYKDAARCHFRTGNAIGFICILMCPLFLIVDVESCWLSWSFFGIGLYSLLFTLSGTYAVHNERYNFLILISSYYALNIMIFSMCSLFFIFYTKPCYREIECRTWIVSSLFVFTLFAIAYNIHAYYVISRAYREMRDRPVGENQTNNRIGDSSRNMKNE